MALPQYDMEILIQNIQRRCTVPTSQLTFTEDDWAAMATDELGDSLIPILMSTREEYFVEYTDVSLTDGVIEIPSDTIGEKLRSVVYLQSGSPINMINLPRIDLDIVAGYNQLSFTAIAGFYITGNKLNIYPSNALPQNSTIRLYYYKRRLALAAPADYGKITSIDTGTLTLTLSNVPNEWTTGTQVNAVSSIPNFKTTNPLMTITAVSSPSIIVDNVDDLTVGDFVSDLGWSAVPQIPVETHGYLAQLVAVKALEGLGAFDGMKVAQSRLNEMKPDILIMTSNRVDGSAKKVVNPNRMNGWNGGLVRRWGSY